MTTLPIRRAVLDSPDYPFTPVDAPIKLDQNEAPLDFPADLKRQVLQVLAEQPWNRYPDLHANRLRDAIARFEDWEPAGCVVTTGSNVLIALLIQLSGLGARVVTVTPNFTLYGLDARLLDVGLTEVPLQDDFSMDMGGLREATETAARTGTQRARPDDVKASDATDLGAPAGVIYLPRPHGPTGSLAALADLEALATDRPNWLVVIDEAYHHYTPQHAADIARRHDNVLLLRTFSKAWGLAGIRLGYALAQPALALQLQKLVPPFAASVVQMTCAEVALANPQYLQEHIKQTVAERERVYTALRAHPQWRVAPSHANFLLIRTPDAARAQAALLEQGILVRRQDKLPGLQGCIRVTVGTPQENDAFLAAAARLDC